MHDWPPLVATATVMDALWIHHQLDHGYVSHARGTLAQSSCYQPKRALKTDQWKPHSALCQPCRHAPPRPPFWTLSWETIS